jgi:hypothetical protein
LRFEESLIKICIEKLEDSAKRINELRQIHVDENYEEDVKSLVSKEIREKIDEYYRVWYVLRNYFEEAPLSYAPGLDDINSILWEKDLNGKLEPNEYHSLMREGMGFYEPDDSKQRADKDVNRIDLFQALKDIDIIDELNSEESSILSLQKDAMSSSMINETTLVESNQIKSFQDFYLRILDEKGLTEGKPPPKERPASPIKPPDRHTDTTKGVLDKIGLMKQYRDLVDGLRPDLNARIGAPYNGHEEAHGNASPVDTGVIDDEAREFEHKLKYYTIEQDPDLPHVSNHTPELAVYSINGTNEKSEDFDVRNNVEASPPAKALEIGVSQEERTAVIFGNVITDSSMIFGIMLFTVGAYLMATNLLSSSRQESTETIVQVLYSLIDQLPGVPISVNYMSNFNNFHAGVVVLAIGIVTTLMSFGLMRKMRGARSVGTFLYISSSIFDVIDILYFGSVGSPLNILAFIINLFICGIFLKDTFWVNYRP